ncbi:MAG TPA: tRNA pseudouridine(38-40) synthase TruA [Anaerolineales bacterium]
MTLYKSILAYDGTDFRGFQRLSADRRTVQAEVESALRRLGWTESSLRAAGRTDAGVHARGQVVSFKLDWGRPAERLKQALNAALPGDIAVLAVDTAPEGFHPRFSANRRRYRYTLRLAPDRDPLRDRYGWQVWPPPDPARLDELGGRVAGRRDFGAFGRSPSGTANTVRQVFLSDWQPGPDGEREFVIEADAFLYHMVRRIVGAMVQVGRGRRSPEEFQASVEDPRRRWQGGLAPARGLCLDAVLYDGQEGIEGSC